MDNTKLLSCAVSLIAALVTGCASPGNVATRLSLEDLEAYQVDCRKRDAQLAFLEAQLPAQLGTVTENGEPLRDPYFRKDFGYSVLQSKIKYIKTWCPKK
mgnify:CR=1 FL=1